MAARRKQHPYQPIDRAATAALRTVEGVQLHQTTVGQGDRRERAWSATIDGVSWLFVKATTGRNPALWKGYTANHLTGCGIHYSLKSAIRWIQAHRREIAQKLATRATRAPGGGRRAG
jgi:hypothetical protein